MTNKLHDARINNVSRIAIGYLNINSAANKFEILRKILKEK